MASEMAIQSPLIFLLLVSPLIGSSFSAFLAPVTKDFRTKKYILMVCLSTPPKQANLVLDLSASSTSLNCNHTCSSYSSISGCSDSHGSCAVTMLTKSANKKPPPAGRPVAGSLSMPTTDGRNPGKLGLIPEFMFSCGGKGPTGLAGFGRSNLSIPAQISKSPPQKPVFALCLSGSPSAPGVAFFGSSGPYFFNPEIELTKFLNYTPLVPNPKENGYFIGLTSIKVNERELDFDRKILAVGGGGAQLSTVTPYTVVHSSIFKALTEVFVNESFAMNLCTTGPVEPFRVCYSAEYVGSTAVGPAVPTVDLVLGDDGVVWRIEGANSMVRVYGDGVDLWCLGFVDGGAMGKSRSAVVIGGHQMEDTLVQFDLEENRLGFTSSVLMHGTMCGNFNFTTNSKSG